MGREPDRPERVADPTPPLAAQVTVCGKCGSYRGDAGWAFVFVKADESTPVEVDYSAEVRRWVSVCKRPEHIRVTCRCGHWWRELTVEVIFGKVGQEELAFPTFMRAWSWLARMSGLDEMLLSLSDAETMAKAARAESQDSTRDSALCDAAIEVLRREGVVP